MTTEGRPPSNRSNTTLIVLGLAVVLLLGTVIGLLLARDQPPATTLAVASTTTPLATTTTTTTPATTTTAATTTTTQPPEPIEIPASEDTTVNSSEPNDVLGGDQLLQIEQEEDDIIHSLVRFEVAGIPEGSPISSVVLRLTVADEAESPGQLSLVGGPWSEADATWATAPPIGAPITPIPGGMEGMTLDLDVTSLVTGPGTYDFYLSTSVPDGMEFLSREAAAGGPTLVVTLGQPVPGTAEGSVMVGAGDIAGCDSQGDEATAELIDAIVRAADEAVVFTTGDNAYEEGSEQNFLECYDPSWGRHKDITRPALGAREYRTPGASGYFDYFGIPPGERSMGYYSYDFGGWHVVVLNSNCDQVGGCQEGSPQELWLREDLAGSEALCTVAYWHHPPFSSGTDGSTPEVLPLFQALFDADAEIVVNGDEHIYERFAPQSPTGEVEDDGIRQFIVGTGGRSLGAFGGAAANSEVRFNGAYGVLVLQLRPDGYSWEFVTAGGSGFSDPGTGECH